MTTTTFGTSTTFASGNYTLSMKAHGFQSNGLYVATPLGANHTVSESNENNNTSSIGITLPTRPDLTIGSLSLGTITVGATGIYSIPVTYTVSA